MAGIAGLILISCFFPYYSSFAQVPVTPAIRNWKIADLSAYIRECDHPLIVNFWATYCSPCINEIPYFQTTATKYKDSGVELLLVSLDPAGADPSRIAGFAQKKNFTAQIIWLTDGDKSALHQHIDSNWSGGLPSSLFINNKLNYRRFYDRQLTERQIEPAVKALVGFPICFSPTWL